MIIGDKPPVDRRKPAGVGWTIIDMNKNWTAWQSGGFCALSSVVKISDEHLPTHWEFLISFSFNGRTRLTNKQINHCLKAFNAEEFEEDNHETGNTRKFWQAVEEKYRLPCPCKDEIQIIEGDYTYSVKKEINNVQRF